MKAKNIKPNMIIIEGSNRYKVLESETQGINTRIRIDATEYPVQFEGRTEADLYVHAEREINVSEQISRKELDRIASLPEDELLLYAVEVTERLKGKPSAQKQDKTVLGILNKYSDSNLATLAKVFIVQYGSDDMAQEKANSFAFGFIKAAELICKDLRELNTL